MVWRVVLSEYMDRQVQTKPLAEGHGTYDKAYKWVLMTYGSTALDCIITGIDMGCHIVKE